jgi:uncharacterized protein YggT (Ycf19 family)
VRNHKQFVLFLFWGTIDAVSYPLCRLARATAPALASIDIAAIVIEVIFGFALFFPGLQGNLCRMAGD